VDPSVDPSEAVLRVKAGKGFKVLVAGRMSPQKGMDVIEAVIKESTGRKDDCSEPFLFFFAGTEELPSHLEHLSRLHPGVVVNLGRLSRSTLSEVMASADILLMPSYYESFGMVAMEGQSQGLPVLCSRIPGLNDIVDDGATGISICGWNPLDYVLAMEKLRRLKMQNEHGWMVMRKAAIDNYRIRFGPEVFDKRVRQFHQKISELRPG
jgi:glycosyltransferase involved in cell wall biosynthesis